MIISKIVVATGPGKKEMDSFPVPSHFAGLV